MQVRVSVRVRLKGRLKDRLKGRLRGRIILDLHCEGLDLIRLRLEGRGVRRLSYNHTIQNSL